MNTLPEDIQQKILYDAIILHKQCIGWGKIHNMIKSDQLYLMKTSFFDSFYKFYCIKRISQLFYYDESPYTWVKKVKNSFCDLNCYCFQSNENRINDLYSFDD
jgi:hypothetical protein